MLKDTTRQAIAIEIMTSLRGDKAVKTVKVARDIFHQGWSDDDIQLMCDHVREHGADNWAEKSWKNDTEQIYKQIYLATLKATDFQLISWLKDILGGKDALKYLVSYEEN